jgi:hypothetical protein
LRYPTAGNLYTSLISRDVRELAQMQVNLSIKNNYLIIEVRGTNSMCAYSTNSIRDIDCLIKGLKRIKRKLEKNE